MNTAEYHAVQAKAMPEADLQNLIVEHAKRLGYLVFHPYDSRRSEPGFPDLTIAGHGRLIFAELKSEKGRATPDQLKWLDTLAEVDNFKDQGSVTVTLWKPSDWFDGTIAAVLQGQS